MTLRVVVSIINILDCMYRLPYASTVEYVWIDGYGGLRSKTRVIKQEISTLTDIPEWNYDGSSTNQANGNDSEITIVPRAMFPLKNTSHIFTMCDTYDKNGLPNATNTRNSAEKIFRDNEDAEPWFGLEQEYFIMISSGGFEGCAPIGMENAKEQGQYYCSVGNKNAFGRKIAETHMRMCIKVGINISGINAEVAPGQWEFQIGPCVGIDAGDHLYMARYLLLKISEEHNMGISFHPKPITRRDADKWNGSGCHVNYSTRAMRDGTNNKSGLDHIHDAINLLSERHMEHMKIYGEDNHLRMTGGNETADYDSFSWGIADRGASIRIGNDTVRNKRGYFEDRRPSSNCDPYLVTSAIFSTTTSHSPGLTPNSA